MKSKLTALMLAVLLLVQAFVPGVALAANASSNPKSVHNLVKVGELDTKSYPKLDNKTILAIQKQAREKQKTQKRKPGAGFFSTDNPYLPGQNPTDEEKAVAYGKVRVNFITTGLNDNGTEKEFQWKEIFGVDSNGNPTNAKIHFIQRDAKTKKELGRYTLLVSKGGEYKWLDTFGKEALLPLYSDKLEAYEYDASLDYQISDKVKLLTMEMGTTNEKSTFEKDEKGRNVATIPLKLELGQVASTKFESEWKTSLDEKSRPQVEGLFNTKNKDQDGFDIENLIAFPKNNTDSIQLRNDNVDPNNPPALPYDQAPGKSFRNVPEVSIVEGLDFSADPVNGTPTYIFDEANKIITTLDGEHKFKYDLAYDVINGGKLTMTEIIPVTFDANGGKFASITEEGAEQKIVKEVDYEKDLTEMPENPTKAGYAFMGWGETADATTSVKDEAFKKIKEAKTVYAIWSEKKIQVPEIPLYETYKEGDFYSSDPNDIDGKGDYPSRVKKEAYIDNGDGTKLTFNDQNYVVYYVPKDQTDGLDKPIKTKDHLDAEKQFKEAISEEKSSPSDIFRKVTWRFQIVKQNDDSVKPRIVEATFKVYKNIYPGLTNGDKPSYVPDEFVKVTVNPTDKAVNKQVKYYYVNPFAKVVIPEENPTGNGDNQFVKWTVKEDESTEEKDITLLGQRNQFKKASTITAQYESDVIPQTGKDKPTTVPENYVSVTFNPTDNGTLEGTNIFWVNPDKEVTIPVATPSGKEHFTFTEWKIGDVSYNPKDKKQFTENTKVTANYKEAPNIIPYDPKEPITRPDGYVRITFEVETGLKLTESKAYYVKKNAKDAAGLALTLKAIKDDTTNYGYPGYSTETGYTFDKWNPADTTEIHTTDIIVKAKATALADTIEKVDENTKKPDGYVEVKFVAGANGTVEEKTYFVNPNKYVTLTPPTATGNIGYEFGAWSKDATNPTNYKIDTTITASFNQIKAVVPKVDDQTKKPDGYKTVTFKIEGKGGSFVEGETIVYYVDPNREVTLQAPQTNAETGYKFKAWDKNTATPTKYDKDTTVKGNFEKQKDIIPAEENGTPNAKPDGYVTVTFEKGEHGTKIEDQTVYYVNPKADPAKTLGDPSIVKPKVKAETGYKFTGWDTKDDFEIKDNKTVIAQYEALEDVIPKTKNDDSEKPEGYITVTFSTEMNGKIKGTDKTKKVVYVNPNKAVVLKGQDPEVTPNTGFDFADWDTQIVKKIQYGDGDTIKALYNVKDDVIPQENSDGSDKPAGYLTVTFDKGEHGTLSGKTVYYVKPDKEVTVPAPTVTPATGYEFGKWDKELTQTFAEDTTITAGYKTLANIIPQEKTDGSDKPNGYVTVKFEAVNGTLSGTTTYYVNGEKLVDLTNTADAITKKADVGYTADGGTWDKALKAKFADGDVLTFTFKALDDVIEVVDGKTKPDGYVTVKLIPTDKATDETKAEKSYWVNPKKENVTIPSTNPVGKEITDANNNTYTFTFKHWTSTRGIHGTWVPSAQIKGTFTQDTDIEAKYNVKAEKLINGPIAKDGVVTPKGDVPKPEDLIKNPYDPVNPDNKDNLPDGTTFTYKGGNPDLSEPGEKTVVVEVHYPNGKTAIVNVPITVADNVVPQTGKDKPKVPDSYVKVTVDTTDKATDNTKFKKVFWVKPNEEVTIPDILAPTGKPETDASGVTKTNKFVKWQRQGADPEIFYETEIKDTFAGETTIIATYEQDKNVEPKGKDNPWIPQKSNPTPKDFIENPYDDNDPNNKDNLPPGTKFEFVPGTEPNTSEPGEGKTTIKVIYPNGETKEVPVKYRVTGDAVEQPDPNNPDTKPAVPDTFVKVIVDKTEKAQLADGENQTRVFWVNPNKEVTLDIDDPTGGVVKDDQGNPEMDISGKEIRWIFKGWDHSLKDNFTEKETTITAQYTKTTSEPDITAGMITTYVGTKPTTENYQEVIKGVSFETDVSKVEITTEPDVSKVGMTKAEIKITFKNDDVKMVTVPVKVLKKETRPGGSSGGVIPSKPEKPSEGDLNKDDHYQYLIGYPDGTFAPNRGMTRAEVATMFTRLLKDRPVKWLHYSSGLSDIYAGDWYADTVGYAVEKGIVSGYPDGTFRPNQPITRAEFASIASRFAQLTDDQDISFIDLDASHWGYKAVRSAASHGWISGYPDGSFRPEKAISRAEVTSITNRMLNRYADLDWIDAHRAEVIRFSDVGRSDWFFEPVMEATMGHDFTRDADGKTEHWTGLNGKTFI